MEKLVKKLFEEIRPGIKIQIYARITENGDLEIEGVDSGDLVEKLKGDWDYEYYLTVKQANKELLKTQLSTEWQTIDTDEELLDWIRLHYSHHLAFSAIQELLQKLRIEFSQHSWT